VPSGCADGAIDASGMKAAALTTGASAGGSTMMVTDTPVADWIRLIRAEYEEMPGLVLTCPQVRRLWGIDCAICEVAMDDLVRCGFLVQGPNGAYGRPPIVSARSCHDNDGSRGV
jgi:hypothetical protein